MVKLRVALGIVALVVCAWFELGIRQAHDTAAATAIVTAHPQTASAAQTRKVESLLHAAGQLNPDVEVDLLRGRIVLAGGDPAGARRIIAAVTRAEPRNLEAWLTLASASTDSRPSFLNALEHVRRLEPLLPAR
ncbi:MAG TPA: hypothetical protein VNR42_08115 [Solirubrobacteraceae bacterium]|jgi:hypothetical protein|nr:hypothetical protein [Solirubrobacteraceae bacterium]